MSKLFTIAGTSVLDNVETMRFATGTIARRVGVLKRNGHTNIALQELPQAMVKADIVAFLRALGSTAVVPVGRKKKEQEVAEVVAIAATPEPVAAPTVQLTAEEKRIARNNAKREKRAAAKAANVAKVNNEVAPEPEAEVAATPAEGQQFYNTSKIEALLLKDAA